MDLTTKSLEELQVLRKQWYIEAKNEGLLSSIAHIARILGKDPFYFYNELLYSCHNQYRYKTDEIDIYVDDYGRHTTVHYKSKLVCDTHICEQLFVYGKWIDIIKELAIEARRIDKGNEVVVNEHIRLGLVSELTAPA